MTSLQGAAPNVMTRCGVVFVGAYGAKADDDGSAIVSNCQSSHPIVMILTSPAAPFHVPRVMRPTAALLSLTSPPPHQVSNWLSIHPIEQLAASPLPERRRLLQLVDALFASSVEHVTQYQTNLKVNITTEEVCPVPCALLC